MNDEPVKKTSDIHLVDDADMALFTGKNWAQYEPTWRALKYAERPKTLFDFKNINWLALGLAPVWFLYRKMYWSMLAYFVIVYCIDLGLEMAGIKNIPGIVYAIAVQQISRMVYLQVNAKKILEIRKLGETEEVTTKKLAQAGGVSNTAAYVGTAVIAGYLGYAIYDTVTTAKPTITGTPYQMELPTDGSQVPGEIIVPKETPNQ